MPPDFVLNVKGAEIIVSESNCWVCLFTEAPNYDHVYIYEPDTCVIFDCRQVLDMLMNAGYPMQVRRLPLPWDERAYDMYIDKLADELSDELDHFDG